MSDRISIAKIESLYKQLNKDHIPIREVQVSAKFMQVLNNTYSGPGATGIGDNFWELLKEVGFGADLVCIPTIPDGEIRFMSNPEIGRFVQGNVIEVWI